MRFESTGQPAKRTEERLLCRFKREANAIEPIASELSFGIVLNLLVQKTLELRIGLEELPFRRITMISQVI